MSIEFKSNTAEPISGHFFGYSTEISGLQLIMETLNKVSFHQYDSLFHPGMPVSLAYLVPVFLTVILIIMSVVSLTDWRAFNGYAWATGIWICSLLLVLSPLVSIALMVLYIPAGTLLIIFDWSMYMMVLAGVIWLLPAFTAGFDLLKKKGING